MSQMVIEVRAGCRRKTEVGVGPTVRRTAVVYMLLRSYWN